MVDSDSFPFSRWYSLRVIPIAPATAIHLVFTAGIPMLAVVASQMPLAEFFEFLKSILLL